MEVSVSHAAGRWEDFICQLSAQVASATKIRGAVLLLNVPRGVWRHASHLHSCESVFQTLCHNNMSVFLCACVCCVLCVVQIRQRDLLFSPQPEPIDSPQAGGPGTTAFCQSLEWAGGWMDYSIVAWSTQPEISHYIKLKPVIRKTMAWKLRNPVLF